jgi:NADH-quinone oxidoreductase subunit L
VLAAVAGFLLAWLLYYKRRDLPQKIADGFGTEYRFVLNKYYVDEFYQALFVRPLVKGSSKLLWRGIDATTIDGAINNSAHGAQEVSSALRHMQSGNIRSYAGWVALGALALVVYMLLVGIR